MQGTGVPFSLAIAFYAIGGALVIVAAAMFLRTDKGKVMGVTGPRGEKSKATTVGHGSTVLQDVSVGGDLVLGDQIKIERFHLTAGIPAPQVRARIGVQNVPGREFHYSGPTVADQEQINSWHVTTVDFDLQAQYVPPKLKAEVYASSVRSLALSRNPSSSMPNGFQTDFGPDGGLLETSAPVPGGYTLTIFTEGPVDQMRVRFLT
jgi:hypothetical protein